MKGTTNKKEASLITTNRTISKVFADFNLGLFGWSSFIAALRSHYETDNELPALVADSSIPKASLSQCFVNLALIEQVVQEREERSLISNASNADAALERGELYQSILDAGKFCSVERVFDKASLSNRSSPLGWVCVTGRAGTGKTTLLQYIAYRWGLRESLWNNRFEFVLRAKLNLVGEKDFWEGLSRNSGEDDLAYLIFKTLGSSKGLSLKDIRACLSHRANQVLILLDGFDEIQTRYGEGRDVRITALVDAAMRFPNGILTSRPNAIPTALTPKFKQCFENLGLTQENVRQYVTYYFKALNQPQLGERLLNELSSNLEMMSLAQIPVNVAALCLTWGSVADDSASKAFTMTMLYQRVVIWLSRRYDTNFRLTKDERVQGINPATMPTQQILERCQEELQTLAKLAYDGFINNEIQTLSHALLTKHYPDQAKLHRITAEFGLLRKESLAKTNDTYPKHYFIHLTYQEYFTALYMAQQLAKPVSNNRAEEIQRRQSIQDVVRFIVNNKNESRCAVIWVFLAGLVSTPEYAQGADYFWDALIDLSLVQSDDACIIGLHPQIKVLQKHQRVLREALFVYHARRVKAPDLRLPTRLEGLQNQFAHMMQWWSVCQTRVLLSIWDNQEHNDQTITKIRQQYKLQQQQYQHDVNVLGLGIVKPLSLSKLFTIFPAWIQQLDETRERVGRDLNLIGRRDKEAMRLLGQINADDPVSLQVLNDAMSDSDKGVCAIAAITLSLLRANNALSSKELGKMVYRSDSYDPVYAAYALGQLELDDESISTFRAVLRSNNWKLSRAAREALDYLGVKHETMISVRDGHWRDNYFRGDSRYKLDGTASPELLNELYGDLKYGSLVGEGAACALGSSKIKDETSLNNLRTAMLEGNERAAEALANLSAKDEISLSALRTALVKDDHVGRAAAEALASLDANDEMSLNALRAALSGSISKGNTVTNGDFQDAVTKALCQMGVKNEPTISIYREMLMYYGTSQLAAKALKYISSELCDVLTIRALLGTVVTDKYHNIAATYNASIALLRILPQHYILLPELITHPIAQRFFIMSIWLHASSVIVDVVNKKITVDHQSMPLDETPWNLSVFVKQLQAFQTEFIMTTAEASSPELPGILQILNRFTVLPRITEVFDKDFTTKGLPEEIMLHDSHIKICLRAVEAKTTELNTRVEELSVSGAHTTENITNLKRTVAKHTDAIEALQEDQKPSTMGLKQFSITAAGVKAANAAQRNQTTTNLPQAQNHH